MKNFLRLLEAIERKRPVGTLVLGRRGHSCDLFIEEDRIYYAGREFSGKVDMEGLVQSSLLGTRISPPVLEAALSGANLVQKPLPEILFERGLINPQECSALMVSHVREEIFGHVFRQGESFSFQESQVPEHLLGEDPLKSALPVQALIQLLKSRSGTLEAVEALLPSRKEILVVTEKGMAHRNSPEGDYAARRMFDLIDGFRTLNEIIRDVIFFEFQVLSRIAAALLAGHMKKTVLPEVRDVAISKLDQQEAAKVLPAFKAAVKHAVDEIGCRERLALLHEHMGNSEEAIIQYNFIGDALYRMKKIPKALKSFQRALDLHPGDPLITDKVIKILQEAAEEALREGRRDAALGLLHSAVKIRPDIHDPFERLLALHMEAGEVEKVAALCDAAVERSHSEHDISVALDLLKAAAEKFPENSLFRKKLVNIYIDFGMPEEAVAELEELAHREMTMGHTARANEILEKILRIDPDRDDIRRHLRGTGRRRVPSRRVFHLRVSVVRLILVVLLVTAGYQYWSYADLQPFLESARAYAHPAVSPPDMGIERSAREEQLLALAAGAERFQERFPFSVFVFEAERLAKQHKNEAARMGRDRDRRKQEIYKEAMALSEKGNVEAAVRAFRRLLICPANDPWRIRAARAIEKIEGYESSAVELRRRAGLAASKEDWAGAYYALRRLLDEYPLSRLAAEVELPVLVRTIPDGATLSTGGEALGPSPILLKVRPRKPCQIEAEAPGFLPLAVPVADDGGPDRLLILNRRPAWTASLGAAVKHPPVLSRDLVLLVLSNGALTARSIADGSARWTFPGGSVVAPVAPPVEAEGRLFLPLNDGQIIGFSPSGEVEARIKPHGLIATPLLVMGGTLAYGTTSGTVSGWDLARSAPAWTVPVRGAPIRLARGGDGEVVVGVEKGRVLRIEVPAGRTLWEATIGEEIVQGPVEVGAAVVVETADHRLVVLDPKSGSIISRRPLGAPFRSVALPGLKRLLLAEEGPDGATTLIEIDPASPQPTARASIPLSTAALFDLNGAAGAALSGGDFLHLEQKSYLPRWGYRPSSGRVTGCASDGKLLVLATDTGELIAFQN